MIPKRFIRIWVGKNEMPAIFQGWWNDLEQLHPTYEFLTITNDNIKSIVIPDNIKPILKQVKTCAGLSDILRILILYQIGGIYVDTDIMPLKSFDSLLDLSNDRPFLGKRSSKSFESAVIGCPKNHPIFLELINALPNYFTKNLDRSASVQTGPAFISSILFGRDSVLHLPSKTFYPYNGFMAPKRAEKNSIFLDKSSFPQEMIAAHFSNHIWGGNPNKQ